CKLSENPAELFLKRRFGSMRSVLITLALLLVGLMCLTTSGADARGLRRRDCPPPCPDPGRFSTPWDIAYPKNGSNVSGGGFFCVWGYIPSTSTITSAEASWGSGTGLTSVTYGPDDVISGTPTGKWAYRFNAKNGVTVTFTITYTDSVQGEVKRSVS